MDLFLFAFWLFSLINYLQSIVSRTALKVRGALFDIVLCAGRRLVAGVGAVQCVLCEEPRVVLLYSARSEGRPLGQSHSRLILHLWLLLHTLWGPFLVSPAPRSTLYRRRDGLTCVHWRWFLPGNKNCTTSLMSNISVKQFFFMIMV